MHTWKKKYKSGGKTVPHSDLRAGTFSQGCRYDNPNSIKILQWNTGGLSQAKKTELTKILTDHQIDVFTIQEANLTQEQLKYYHFKDFTVHILPKGRQISSGILVGIRAHLTSSVQIIKEMDNMDKIEIIKINVWTNKSQFNIYSVYNPPNNSPNLDHITINPNTIIMGDFNAHSRRWGYTNSNNAGKIIEDLLNSTPIEIIHNKEDPPTYIHYSGSGTNPDLLIVSSDLHSKTKKQIVEDPGSGHRAIIATIQLGNNKLPSMHLKPRWNFKKANWKMYTEELESKFENPLNESLQPDQINKSICEIILKTAKKYIPRGIVKNYKPFWNTKLENMKKDRDLARNKAEKTKDPKDVQNWRKLCAQFKKEINSSKRENFSNFLQKMDYRKDGQKAYRFIHNIQNKKERHKTPFIYNNKQITNENTIANKFNKHYANSYTLSSKIKKEQKTIKGNLKNYIKSTNSTKDNIFNKNFNMKELNIAINSLKSNKSPGADNVHAEFLKHLGNKAKTQLLSLYNLSWNTKVPDDWKKAVIIPILKPKKSTNNFSNYRPIALTSVIVKTIEKMISNRLNWYLETNNLLSPNQAGFRELRSTNQQIVHISQDIKDSFNRKEDTLAIFVDFQGAYDSIWRYKLLEKMQILGIQGNMLHWISNFIIQRFIATNYNNHLSKYQQTHRGLPQGSVLSPILFNIYINDLPRHIEKFQTKTLLFADDVVIWDSKPKNQSQQLISTAQTSLIELENWSSQNLMKINIQKTNYQLFSLRKKPLSITLKLEGDLLNETHEAKYLGITFDTKLTWKKHIENICTKIETKLPLLKRLAGKKWGCSTQTLNTFYQMYMKPILQYCEEILITTNVEKLNKLQNQILRLITGAVKTTPITAMQILTNNPNIAFDIEKTAIIQYEKLLRLPHNNWIQRKPEVCLKSQQSFLSIVQEIKQNLQLPHLKENLQIRNNPLEFLEIEYNLHLAEVIKKSETSPLILKQMSLEIIQLKYPTPEWMHVFTDGSSLPNDGGTGAGAVCPLFSFYRKLNTNSTNFDGEILAIFLSLQNLLYHIQKFTKVVILCDSKAAILAITQDTSPKSLNIIECHKIIKHLSRLHKKVVLQWIPAHCGVAGNETADFLAKKGSKIVSNSTPTPISFHSIKRVILNKYINKIREEYTTKASGKEWKNLQAYNISTLQRKSAVATFRLLTGHDCLNKHLHRFGIANSPKCTFCNLNEDMERNHLLRCPAFIEETNLPAKYWSARERMISLSSARH